MIRPLVTVGIPFLNPGAAFVEAVQSVFAQTFGDWELILMDDRSTDGSLELVRKINDPRVKVFSDGVNRGLPERLNQIARLAQGRFLARMDADDLMHPERLGCQLATIEGMSENSILGASSWIIDERGNIVGKREFIGGQPTVLEVFKWGGLLHPSIIGHRNWFLDNPYDSNYPRAEDRELFARKVGETHLCNSEDKLYFYRYCRKINIKSYLMSYSTERKVLLNYGPCKLGRMKAYSYYLRSWLKSFSIPLCVSFLGDEWVVRKGYTVATDDEAKYGESILNGIRDIEVPGWMSDI